jgi:tetratricopeptide (TPR) repeat protein
MTRRAPAGNDTPARGASGAVYPISLCMIVRNEERFLRDALASVQGVVDEICIVDTGSTDGTVAIAQSCGARISFISWRDDFAWARNAALAMATGAWIFVLDADERLAPDSRERLQALRGMRPDGQGRWIRCRNLNDAAREIVASTNAIVRIFPNDPAVRYRGTLHEYVARAGEEHSLAATMTPIEILHYGYLPEVMSERGKSDRNVRVSRAAFEAAPEDPALVYNYAMSALLAGERENAREQLERVLELTRGTPRGFRPMALATLAGIYLEDGRPADALAAADDCVSIVATLPDGHFVRGRALAAQGRYEEARAALGEAISVGSNRSFEHFVVDDEIAAWKAHNEIGGTLVSERRFAEARRWLELGLAARPAERTLILNRARCCEAEDDLAEALAAFRAVFDGYQDEAAAIEYVNFVFRHGSPDIVLAAVEQALPVLGEDYRRAFLTAAAAAMLRAGRRDDAGALLRRVMAVGDAPAKGRAIVKALAQQYGIPELNRLLDGDLPHAITVSGRWT